jgi:hypothetical protein
LGSISELQLDSGRNKKEWRATGRTTDHTDIFVARVISLCFTEIRRYNQSGLAGNHHPSGLNRRPSAERSRTPGGAGRGTGDFLFAATRRKPERGTARRGCLHRERGGEIFLSEAVPRASSAGRPEEARRAEHVRRRRRREETKRAGLLPAGLDKAGHKRARATATRNGCLFRLLPLRRPAAEPTSRRALSPDG